MYLDDVDYNFKGNKDNYWCCEKCQTSCIEEIRYGKPFKEIWHIENNDIRTAESVLNAINSIEKEIGAEKFRKTFKTITCDNGVEFTKHKEIETSIKDNMRRTYLYFCHAFCSSERGSNENANKLIRKYIPKSTDIDLFTDEYIKQIEDLINNYPRKMFDGLSSNEYARTLGL